MKGKRALWIPIALGAVAVLAFLLIPGGEEAAEAGFSDEGVEDLVAYVKSDASWNLRLQALEALRKKDADGIEGELDDLARGSDLRLAVAATTSMGRMTGSTAKSKLKKILEAKSLDTEVRIGALSAIAYHWKDADDLSYLEKESKNDSKLLSAYKDVKKRVYGK